MSFYQCLFVLAMLACCRPSALQAQEWTRFRGPNGSGLSDAATVPVQWTEKDLNWKVELPGIGHSQPVLWRERIFLTSAEDGGKKRHILCLDASDGKRQWMRTLALETHSKHDLSSFASSTPAVDAELVFAAFADRQRCIFKALDHQGETRWSVELGGFSGQHAFGTSPMIDKETVILAMDQDKGSYLVALERATGKTRWKIERRDSDAAYGTPCILERQGSKPELILSSKSYGLSSLDPGTGKLNWEAPLFDKRAVSSPVLAGDLVLGTCGSGAGGSYLVAVRAGGTGDVAVSNLAYKLTRSMPYVPTPVVKGDRAYLWSDGGIVTCIKTAGGDIVWQQRVGGNYLSSPVCIGKGVYNFSTSGEAVVLAADDEFKVLGRSPLGEGSHSSPAVANGKLYVRTLTHLLSVGGAVKP